MSEIHPRYRAMSTWKTKQIKKLNKGKSERSGLGRSYVAIPPPEGWPGGDPLKNGLKA